MRPEPLRCLDWWSSQMGKINRSLSVFEEKIDTLADTVDIGTITLACALGYLDFRFFDVDCRSSFPKLAAWYSTFSDWPSIRATVPYV